MSGYKGAFSGKYPMFCCALIGFSSTLIPLIQAEPLLGERKPVRIFSVVDLPAPLGPRNPTTSPLEMEKLILFTAWCAP